MIEPLECPECGCVLSDDAAKSREYPADLHKRQTEHHPGPWSWRGNTDTGDCHLVGDYGMRPIILDAVSWHSIYDRGEISFNVNDFMWPSSALARFSVDKSVVGVQNVGPSVYRRDFFEIVHPDAMLIAAAPDLLDACEAAWKERKGLSREAVSKLESAFRKARGLDVPLED